MATTLKKKTLTSMKVAELKEELELRGLPKSGNKQKLIDRLEDWILTKEPHPEHDQPGSKRPGDVEVDAAGPSKKVAAARSADATAAGSSKDKVECTKKCLPDTKTKKSICPNRRFGKMTRQMKGRTILACVEVERMLKEMGIDPAECSRCILAAIQNGAIEITGKKEELETVLYESKGEVCDCKIPAKLGDVLLQGDYGGGDYEDNESSNAKVYCWTCKGKQEEEEDYTFGHFYFLTGMCDGQVSLNSGKWHNHCYECPGYGVCLHDYREAHCSSCGGHGYRGACYTKGCSNKNDWGDLEPDPEDIAMREMLKKSMGGGGGRRRRRRRGGNSECTIS